MKVEFIVTREYGDFNVVLKITAVEFLKAEKDDNERNSMCAAIDAYCTLSSNANFVIHSDEYKEIKKQLKRNDVVIFATGVERRCHNLLTYVVHEGVPKEALEPIEI